VSAGILSNASLLPLFVFVREPHNIGRQAIHYKLGLEGIVSKRKDSAYRSERSPDWFKMKNSACSAVKREEEEDWGR
jgi:ATP-dependent DNA ligase